MNSSLPMTLHVRFAEGDFREASVASKSLGVQTPSMIAFFYLYLAFTVGSIVGGLVQPEAFGVTTRNHPIVVILTRMPLMFVAAYWAVVVFRRPAKRHAGFVRPLPSLPELGVVVPAILCVVVFAVTAWCGAQPDLEPPAAPAAGGGKRPSPFFSLMTTLAPIAALVIAALFLTFRVQRAVGRRAWLLQPHLQMEHTLVVGQDGIIFSDPNAERRYRWETFYGWHETNGLFVLYRSYVSFEMVPKRAFKNPHDFEQFVQLIRHYIGDQVGGRGFELVPRSQQIQPPPLPRQ